MSWDGHDPRRAGGTYHAGRAYSARSVTGRRRNLKAMGVEKFTATCVGVLHERNDREAIEACWLENNRRANAGETYSSAMWGITQGSGLQEVLQGTPRFNNSDIDDPVLVELRELLAGLTRGGTT